MTDYNPINLFGKKPNFYNLDGKIYIIIPPSNISKVIKYHSLIFIQEIFSYCILISNKNYSNILGEEKHKGIVIPMVVDDCPKFTIAQLHYYIIFCLSGISHKLTYENFIKLFIDKNVIKKVLKDNTHKKPQNRFKPVEYAIWAGIFEDTDDHDTPLIFPLGINRLLSSDCFDFKSYCNSLISDNQTIIII